MKGLRITADDAILQLRLARRSSGSGSTDHGALTGLADDDHAQYHTDARGDARYQPLDTQLTALAGLSYASNATKVVRVNGAENGFELAASAGGTEAFKVGGVYINVTGVNPGTELGYGTWSAFGAGRVLVGLDAGDPDFDTAEETGGSKTTAAAGTLSGIAVSDHAAHTHSVTSNVTVADHSSHTHTYTDVVNHVHLVEGFPTATGGSTGFTRDTSMSGTPANTNQQTATPTGGVATGTTAGPGATLTHSPTNNAVTSGNPSAALTHTVSSQGAFTGSATSVVQPYIVAYFWKRTA